MNEKTQKAVCFKTVCHGFLDGNWEDYLIPHDFKFIVSKGQRVF